MSNSRKNNAKPGLKNKPSHIPNQPHPTLTNRPTASPQSSQAGAGRSTVETKPGREEITTATIAEAAYYIWLKRGGDHVSNWLEAERQLKTQSTAARH